MKMKHLIIVSLILAILTIGAVSASDDVASDDVLAVSDEGDALDVPETDELGELNGEDDVYIDVDDIDPDEPEENFTSVAVAEKAGDFVICVGEGEDTIELLREDLADTDRPYEMDEDEFYNFGFSFDDLNNYIRENVEDSDGFMDLVDAGIIADGDRVKFVIEYVGEDIYVQTKVISFPEDNMILFDDEEEEDDAGLDYVMLDVIKYDDWKSETFLDFKIRKGITGNIIIDLNGKNVFNKSSDDFEETFDDEENENFTHYLVNFDDLNCEWEDDEYEIAAWVIGEDDESIWEYDEEEPEFLIFYEPQVQSGESGTVDITPFTTVINDEHALIAIDTNDTSIKAYVYIDEDEEPVVINLEDCEYDEETNDYLIGFKELNLRDVGQHTLNVTFGDVNLVGVVDLISNIEFGFPEDFEVVYTGYGMESNFIAVRLYYGEIGDSDITGKVNVTVYDDDGNVMGTMEMEITDLYYHHGPRAYVVNTADLGFEEDLDGVYRVVARYFDGNEASVEDESDVVFQLFSPEEFGTRIMEDVFDEDDYVITFEDIPQYMPIIVQIDDDDEILIEYWDLREWYDDEEDIYYIPFDELRGLENGEYFITVSVDLGDDNIIELTNGTVNVDIDDEYYLDSVEFIRGNAVTNDVVIIIPKEDLPDMDDEFDIFVNDEFTNSLLLSDLEDDDDNYYLRVDDLNIEEFDEELYVRLQFYNDGEESFYADDELDIYENPYINDVATLENDYPVISFNAFEEDVDDEFIVTIRQDGLDDIVKTFKISELDEPYELYLDDLGIADTGIYTIAVNFTNDGEQFISNEKEVNVVTFIINFWGDSFESVEDFVFTLKIPENVTGFVKIFNGENQVGDDINLSDLEFGIGGPTWGRNIPLNLFDIDEGGNYNVKVEVYNEDGELVNEIEVEIEVAVAENTVEFHDAYYTDDNIIFDLGSPISQDSYFIIYLNGNRAGSYYLPGIFKYDDEFVDVIGGDRFLKKGDYEVNVTFFDGESETDFKTGSFTVKSLNLTSDNDVYSVDDEIVISFDSEKLTKGELRVSYHPSALSNFGETEDLFIISGKNMAEYWNDGKFVFHIGNASDYALGENIISVAYENGEEFRTDVIVINVANKTAPENTTPANTTPAVPSVTPSNETPAVTAPKDVVKLTLKKVKVKKSAKKLVLQATLKINGKAVKGKVIKFKFNGKTYKAKTNKNGIAKVTIKKSVLKKLKVGKKVKYQASYGKTTAKRTVKVKR